ncbi:protoporphyrinogen oxidase [Knoellia locipacati]|uniref:protoporphyrinogen oxidase n=1 Tax=Knoellia locipacati TaxID=882824 RepID=UPI00384D4E46
MPRMSFFVGLAAGYVLGARAGKQRYAQIKTVSGKVWQSKPVQKQVAAAKESARTKAAPVVADFVADAAKATSEKLRASRTVPSQVSTGRDRTTGEDPWVASSTARDEDPWGTATRR